MYSRQCNPNGEKEDLKSNLVELKVELEILGYKYMNSMSQRFVVIVNALELNNNRKLN